MDLWVLSLVDGAKASMLLPLRAAAMASAEMALVLNMVRQL